MRTVIFIVLCVFCTTQIFANEVEIIENVDKRFSFETSSDCELSDEIKKYLEAVAEYLKVNPGATVGVTGHSDNISSFEENDRRARERAANVQKYLIKKGIPASRILAGGKGSIEPIASNSTAEGRKKNRRVEIRVVPTPKKEIRREVRKED